jgi:acetoacetate decarboxylase
MTTQTILTTTVYGTPSGNYDGSSQDWFSDAVQAANYYRGQGSVQTIAFTVTGFRGTMTVEATLDSTPESAAWFDTFAYTAGAASPVTQYYPATVVGNFTWIRIRVDNFAAGTIGSVVITY